MGSERARERTNYEVCDGVVLRPVVAYYFSHNTVDIKLIVACPCSSVTGRHRGSGAGLTFSFEYTLVGEGIEEDSTILHRCARECEVDKCDFDTRLGGA